MIVEEIASLSNVEIDEIGGGPWYVIVGGIIMAVDLLHRENCDVH